MLEQQQILGYIACVIFLVGLSLNIYMLVMDNQDSWTHTVEETGWIYGFLIILIIGFVSSLYVVYRIIV